MNIILKKTEKNKSIFGVWFPLYKDLIAFDCFPSRINGATNIQHCNKCRSLEKWFKLAEIGCGRFFFFRKNCKSHVSNCDDYAQHLHTFSLLNNAPHFTTLFKWLSESVINFHYFSFLYLNFFFLYSVLGSTADTLKCLYNFI